MLLIVRILSGILSIPKVWLGEDTGQRTRGYTQPNESVAAGDITGASPIHRRIILQNITEEWLSQGGPVSGGGIVGILDTTYDHW